MWTLSEGVSIQSKKGNLIHKRRHKEQDEYNRQTYILLLDRIQKTQSSEFYEQETGEENVLEVKGKKMYKGEGFSCDICNWIFKKKTTYDKHFVKK